MRRPLLGARRDHAERYLFVTIAAFAISVAATRWYLEMAGYPKVGGGGLHIAHMLWGGLLLVVAAILPLLFVGRRVLLLSALAAGIGVGLFIDEVGKFVTESNDYFFAPAAPLIYASLLLLVALWLIVRRRPASSVHDALQAAVDATRDGLDGRLNLIDRDRVVAGLSRATASENRAVAALAERQAALLTSPEMEALLVPTGWLARGEARAMLERIVPLRLLRALVLIGLAWTAFLALVASLLLLAIVWSDTPIELPAVEGPVEFPTDPIWAVLLLVVGIAVGVASAVAAVMIILGRERGGTRVAIGAVLVNLAAGGLLTFYVAQFGAVASTVEQLILLALLLEYGRRVAAARPVPSEQPRIMPTT